jgi:hypothetical protein
MRVGDVLYFSPRYRFSELDFDDTKALIDAFQDRVEGFYLLPASRLIDEGHAFAGGLVSCAAVEFIANISGQISASEWIQKNLSDFGKDNKLAERFWNYFRNGLAHEGRVKAFSQGSGQFSLELHQMLTTSGSTLIVNPRLLLEAVQRAFRSYCEYLDESQAARLVKSLRRYFEDEVKASKTYRVAPFGPAHLPVSL